ELEIPWNSSKLGLKLVANRGGQIFGRPRDGSSRGHSEGLLQEHQTEVSAEIPEIFCDAGTVYNFYTVAVDGNPEAFVRKQGIRSVRQPSRNQICNKVFMFLR